MRFRKVYLRRFSDGRLRPVWVFRRDGEQMERHSVGWSPAAARRRASL